MAMTQRSYGEVRSRMQTGDVLAFGGNSAFDTLIKWATNSPVSHVAAIMQTRATYTQGPRFFNQMAEAVLTRDFQGVRMTQISTRLERYRGTVWWLPLSHRYRQSLDLERFTTFLFQQARDRKPYDLWQAVGAGVDILDTLSGLTRNEEDLSRFFCSELIGAALRSAGGLDGRVSEMTPIDICRLPFYESQYYQLKGEKAVTIWGYNGGR